MLVVPMREHSDARFAASSGPQQEGSAPSTKRREIFGRARNPSSHRARTDDASRGRCAEPVSCFAAAHRSSVEAKRCAKCTSRSPRCADRRHGFFARRTAPEKVASRARCTVNSKRQSGRSSPSIARRSRRSSVESELSARARAVYGADRRVIGKVDLAATGRFSSTRSEIPTESRQAPSVLAGARLRARGAVARRLAQDVRVVCATHRDLRALSRKESSGRYIASAVVEIVLPPLRVPRRSGGARARRALRGHVRVRVTEGLRRRSTADARPCLFGP